MIVSSNAMMEGLIQKQEKEITGKLIYDIFPEIKKEAMLEILAAGKDYSFQAERNNTQLFTMVAPIVVDGSVDGAIVTCHRMRRPQMERTEQETNADRKKYAPVMAQFSDIIQYSEVMQECVQMAKLFAYSEQPVVLRGEPELKDESLPKVFITAVSERRDHFWIFHARVWMIQNSGMLFLEKMEQFSRHREAPCSCRMQISFLFRTSIDCIN